MDTKPIFSFSTIIFLVILVLIFFGLVAGIIYLIYHPEIIRISDNNKNVVKNIINEQRTENIRSNAVAFNSEGLDYLNKNDYVNAEVYFRKAIEADPGLANPYNNLGIVFSLTGRQDEALVNFNKAVNIYPSYANAYSNIGVYYKDKKDYPQAIVNFKKAIDIEPNLYKPHAHLGDIYILLGDYKSAEYFYQKALESSQIDPQTVDMVQKQLKYIKQLQSR